MLQFSLSVSCKQQLLGSWCKLCQAERKYTGDVLLLVIDFVNDALTHMLIYKLVALNVWPQEVPFYCWVFMYSLSY